MSKDKMKLLLTIFFTAISLVSLSQETRATENLKESISRFNLAFQEGDTNTLSKMIPENYVHTNGSWKSFGKETWLGYMKERSEKIQKGTLTILTYEMSESHIERYDAVAILTARISTSGIEDGKSFQKSFRVTNLWVFQENRWLRAAFHDTVIK